MMLFPLVLGFSSCDKAKELEPNPLAKQLSGLWWSLTDISGTLPEDFGGAETDNIYAEIRTTEDAIQNSEKTKEFCLQHGTGTKTATLMALFVEEMSADFLADLKDAKNAASKTACLDYRIFTNGEDICFSMMDRIDHLNASTFYDLQNDENPEAHLGIKILLKQADDVRYFTAYGSNNLIVHMKRKD